MTPPIPYLEVWTIESLKRGNIFKDSGAYENHFWETLTPICLAIAIGAFSLKTYYFLFADSKPAPW